jgi:hypothetical protein
MNKRSDLKEYKVKKKSFNVNKLKKPKKKPRINTFYNRFTTNSNNLINLLDTIVIRLLNYILLITDSVQPSNRIRNAGGRLISLPLRSRRNIRLPVRFL